MALAPLTAPKILVKSKVEYDCTVLGPGQIFPRGVFVVVVVTVVYIVVIVTEVVDDIIVVVIVKLKL